jgi:hypothetical protein
MDGLSQLIIAAEERPEAFFSPRVADHYNDLLDFYETIGFGPNAPMPMWRAQTRQSWSVIDGGMSGTSTIGRHGGSIVSSWGTIPVSGDLLYTHSGCMQRSLAGAATLMAQSLQSLSWFDRLPSMNYLAMSYLYRSRFTTQFQRPKQFVIPSAAASEALLCVPVGNNHQGNPDNSMIIASHPQDRLLLSDNHRWIYDRYSTPYEYSAGALPPQSMTCYLAKENNPIALVLAQEHLPFITASDAHRDVLVFPTAYGNNTQILCRALRAVASLANRTFYMFLRYDSTVPTEMGGERVERSFWIATSQVHRGLLKRSYLAAYSDLLLRYSNDQIVSYLDAARDYCGNS